MARERDAIGDNVLGDFFVDSSCIDCDLCRQIAPTTFARSDRAGQSYVAAQPADPQRALMALVTCPTSSIGTREKHDTHGAARAFPEMDGTIGFCGWASENTYGAASWFIRRPDGNVLVDSPRKSAILIERLRELGGVRWMVLTHRDDVADHAAYREAFGCERVVHRADAVGELRACERIVDGDAELAADLRLIEVPGHTRGSIVLLHGDVLFSGDHVWSNEDDEFPGLDAGRGVCWYSWPEQKKSVAKLAAYSFTRVLPGHGRRFATATPDEMRRAVEALAARM